MTFHIDGMMEKKKHILLLACFVTASLLICMYTFNLLVSDNPYLTRDFLSLFFLNLPVCILIGFIDYKIIQRIYGSGLFKNFYFRFLIDILLTTVFVTVTSVFVNWVTSFFVPFEYFRLRTTLPLILWNTSIVLLIEIFRYSQQQVEVEKQLVIAQKEKALYQFEALKNQINPHFLFNSLNVLASLSYQDAEKTNLFAKKLSGVYRYLLATHEYSVVTLREELSFVDSYLFLEYIRFGEALHVEIRNGASFPNKKVIPASLQMLVENALKHNICSINQPLSVCITVFEDHIVVRNNLQLRNSVNKGGIGLDNLRKQYAIYEKQINVEQTDTAFIVILPFIA